MRRPSLSSLRTLRSTCCMPALLARPAHTLTRTQHAVQRTRGVSVCVGAVCRVSVCCLVHHNHCWCHIASCALARSQFPLGVPAARLGWLELAVHAACFRCHCTHLIRECEVLSRARPPRLMGRRLRLNKSPSPSSARARARCVPRGRRPRSASPKRERSREARGWSRRGPAAQVHAHAARRRRARADR